ncbi:hypothetical protein BB559_006300 [Furculomyces boomerangus]|uniref:Carbohydrate-binding module family 19 domain-containing protein n=2 Tax=Harpellales TaxID=61421 RepID=A0A2T9Y3S2_9FUNG|nr:hypothetical protein BB559_006300 [Furculomyces boomerangus]PWA02521.1 hypothetical protein BB558_001370 [Smittium angustum]
MKHYGNIMFLALCEILYFTANIHVVSGQTTVAVGANNIQENSINHALKTKVDTGAVNVIASSIRTVVKVDNKKVVPISGVLVDTSVGGDEMTPTIAPKTSKESTNIIDASSESAATVGNVINPGSSINPCTEKGKSTCSAEGAEVFYSCDGVKWVKSICGAGTVCKMKSNTEAICVDPSVQLKPDEVASNPTKLPCDASGKTMCDSTNVSGYFLCDQGFWASQKCAGTNVCKMKSDTEAVCVDPSVQFKTDEVASNSTKIACDNNGGTMCDSTNVSGYFLCDQGFWVSQKCTGSNVCKVGKGNKVVCVDKAAANIDTDNGTGNSTSIPCEVNGQTKCDVVNPNGYFLCGQGFWVNQKCSGDNVCKVGKDGKVICVDKAAADIKTESCRIIGESRCSKETKTVYEKCIGNEWTRFNCDGDNICGIKDNSAVCYNPKKGGLEGVVKDPCDKEGQQKCSDTNDNMYKQCVSGNWANFTCSKDTVCRIVGGNDQIGCFDPNNSDLPSNKEIIISDQKSSAISTQVFGIYLASFLVLVIFI